MDWSELDKAALESRAAAGKSPEPIKTGRVGKLVKRWGDAATDVLLNDSAIEQRQLSEAEANVAEIIAEGAAEADRRREMLKKYGERAKALVLRETMPYMVTTDTLGENVPQCSWRMASGMCPEPAMHYAGQRAFCAKHVPIAKRRTAAMVSIDKPDPDYKLAGDLEDLVFAGGAVFTIQNTETGNRFTYKVVRAKRSTSLSRAASGVGNPPWFVKVLAGPSNYSNYRFIGTVFQNDGGKVFRYSKKSRISSQAQSVKVFRWLVGKLATKQELPPQVEIHHEGMCLRCGRRLTDPESVGRGIGPVCYGKLK